MQGEANGSWATFWCAAITHDGVSRSTNEMSGTKRTSKLCRGNRQNAGVVKAGHQHHKVGSVAAETLVQGVGHFRNRGATIGMLAEGRDRNRFSLSSSCACEHWVCKRIRSVRW
jgi:hypothetical protein